MTSFLQMLSGVALGVLTGFDRLMFRGPLRTLSYPQGMQLYCSTNGVLLKDFKQHALERTEQLIAGSEAMVKRLGRPNEYLRSPQTRKEEVARAQQDGITDGLIGMFRCVEPCGPTPLGGIESRRSSSCVRSCGSACICTTTTSTYLRDDVCASADVVSVHH